MNESKKQENPNDGKIQVDKNVRLRVIVTNEILGNSERIMTFEQIKEHNVCAYMCAKKAIEFSGRHTLGMWSVEVA